MLVLITSATLQCYFKNCTNLVIMVRLRPSWAHLWMILTILFSKGTELIFFVERNILIKTVLFVQFKQTNSVLYISNTTRWVKQFWSGCVYYNNDYLVPGVSIIHKWAQVGSKWEPHWCRSWKNYRGASLLNYNNED